MGIFFATGKPIDDSSRDATLFDATLFDATLFYATGRVVPEELP